MRVLPGPRILRSRSRNLFGESGFAGAAALFGSPAGRRAAQAGTCLPEGDAPCGARATRSMAPSFQT